MNITTAEIKKAIRQRFAWPGGYEICFLTSDGALICTACARQNWQSVLWSIKNEVSDGWKVEGIVLSDSLENGAHCDHCGKNLSAYSND